MPNKIFYILLILGSLQMSPASAYYLPNQGLINFYPCEKKFTTEQIKNLGYDLKNEDGYKCYHYQPDSDHYIFMDYDPSPGNSGYRVKLYDTNFKRKEFEDGISNVQCEGLNGRDCYKAINRFVFYPINDPQFNKYPHPYLHHIEGKNYLFADIKQECVPPDFCEIENVELINGKYEFSSPFPTMECLKIPEAKNYLCFRNTYFDAKYLNMSRAELEKEFPDIKYGWGNPENAKKKE